MSDQNGPQRRLAIEETSNCYLVKITESGNDKLIGRYSFRSLADTLDFIETRLSKEEGKS